MPATADRWEALFRLPPRLAQRSNEALFGSVGPMMRIKSRQTSVEQLADTEESKDGLFLYVHALSRSDIHDPDRATRNFGAAGQQPSLFRYQRASAVFALFTGQKSGCLEDATADDLIDFLLRQGDVWSIEHRFLADIPYQRGFTPWVREIARRWLHRYTDEPDARFAMIRAPGSGFISEMATPPRRNVASMPASTITRTHSSRSFPCPPILLTDPP